MKQLLENWRKSLKEEETIPAPSVDPSSVKIISPVVYTNLEGSGRLFAVATFDYIDQTRQWYNLSPKRTFKFGFYASSATSGNVDKDAGHWLPTRGIRDDGSWIMKIEGKYANPESVLGQVGSILDRQFPLDWQIKVMGPKRKEFMTREREWEKEGMDFEKAREKGELIGVKNVNDIFRKHGVYDITPQDPDIGAPLTEMKQLTEYIEELEEESRAIDHGSFAIRDSLHNLVWDENDKLDPEVREKLMKIAQDFWAKLELDWNEIMDVTFTGSLANFNWSRHSDIDMHLIVDFESVDENTQLVKDYFNAVKSNWNRRHNIFLKGFEVEIYVQDVSEIHKSSGVYSISKDEWIVKPIKEDFNIDWNDVTKKAESLMNMIDEVENLMNSTHYKTAHRFGKMLKDKLKKFRRCGLDREGEYSSENIAFKALRRNGYIEKLMNAVVDSYDHMMSDQNKSHIRLKERSRRSEFQKKN